METTKTQLMSTREIEEMIKTLPQHAHSWLDAKGILYKYQDVWYTREFLLGRIVARQSFKARQNDVFLCSYPKSGTTWLKALTYAIINREKFDESNTPLLTTTPHKCIPTLERDIERILENHPNTPIATHLPYNHLPESILTSKCKMVYIYRNTKDVIVSYYHFVKKIEHVEDAPFEEAFNDFCQGATYTGPYWDYVSGYSKASLERPETILLLKYEDVKKDPTSNAKRLAEFIGYPFTTQEEKEGVIDSIVKMCSFENLSNLEVNKSGVDGAEQCFSIENKLYFRKAKDGDWQNYFTDEMIEKIDKLIDEKLGSTSLVLK